MRAKFECVTIRVVRMEKFGRTISSSKVRQLLLLIFSGENQGGKFSHSIIFVNIFFCFKSLVHIISIHSSIVMIKIIDHNNLILGNVLYYSIITNCVPGPYWGARQYVLSSSKVYVGLHIKCTNCT